jgi:hypothetical protein
MRGFWYRRAVDVKELGERLHWNWLTRLGLKLRGWAVEHGKVK